MKNLRHACIIMIALFVGLLWSGKAIALSGQAAGDEMVSVRLVSATDTAGNDKEITLGLDVKLEAGVHTYWRSPGIAGLPPTLEWSKSENLEKAELLYPAPKRSEVYGMETIGYEEHVLFPIKASIKDPSQPLKLDLALDILVCKDLCLPKHFDLSLEIPSGPKSESPEATSINEALARVPSKAFVPEISVTALEYSESMRGDGSGSVTLHIQSDRPISAPDMFLESEHGIAFQKPEIQTKDDPRFASLTAKVDGPLPKDFSWSEEPITVTLTHAGKAVEFTLDDLKKNAVKGVMPLQQSRANGAASTIWTYILFALIGGFILNLMPCVLPVLSLKVLSVVKHGGGERSVIRHSFLSTGAGIVLSFILLALATIALKQAGHAIGWGVQFQNPIFLVFMIVLLTFFAANLWGFFHISLPRFIMDTLDPAYHPKLAGDFGTGMLATLLATPCSAPFLGTAVGFALGAGVPQILAVFTALGFGMALPYFTVALWPKIASSLPKPGSWMIILTRVLGFGMALTALWLGVVLSAQIGKTLALSVGTGMFVLLVQLYARGKNIWPRLNAVLMAVVLAGCFSLAYIATVPHELQPQSGAWVKFDEVALQRYVREGKTVFVDITADWCLTCKANKRFTLSQKKITERLFEDDRVIAMQGDYTNPDPVLSAYIQKNGRYGIPFNAVYGPKAPEGILLSELLSADAVLEALDEAKSPSKGCSVDLPDGEAC